MTNVLAWLFFTIFIVFIFILSYQIIIYFNNPNQSNKYINLIIILTLFILILSIVLVPLDVYVVSNNIDSDGMQKDINLLNTDTNIIKNIYYSIYFSIAILGFFILPFVYFLYEEDDEDASWSERICNSLKYSSVFILIVVVFAIVGVFLKINSEGTQGWLPILKDSYNTSDKLVTFFIACLITIGMLGVVVYTGYGLAYVPIEMIRKGGKSNNDLNDDSKPARSNNYAGINNSSNARSFNVSSDLEVDSKIKRNAEHIRFLTSRYALSSNEMSQQDRIKLHELQREEKRLKSLKDQQETDSLKGNGPSSSNCCITGLSACASGICSIFSMVRSVFGVLFGLISLLIIVSIIITSIDKFLNSSCQAACGYALTESKILNPINYVFVEASKFFPLDYFVFGIIAMYMLFCTIAALTHLGVRLVCVTYRITPGKTFGHSLVMLIFVLIFIILALNVEFYTLAPQYATFGTQFYMQSNNGTAASKVVCSLQNLGSFNNTTSITDSCVMTQFSQFSLRMTSTMPTFGVIFFYSTWALVASFILNIIGILTCQSSSDNEHRLLDDKDEDEY